MNKILIVDDDEEMCAELHEILTDEGFEVQVASDGHMGKTIIEKLQHDLVILDLKLPKLNGYEVLKAVKEIPACPKIIVFSGRPLGKKEVRDQVGSNAQEMEEEKVLKLADAVLNKPIQVPLLLSKIRILQENS